MVKGNDNKLMGFKKEKGYIAVAKFCQALL